jgi:hypothetical protein
VEIRGGDGGRVRIWWGKVAVRGGGEGVKGVVG